MTGNKKEKAIILRMFAAFGKEDQQQRMEIYLQRLKDKNLTTQQIYDLTNNAIDNSEYLPFYKCLLISNLISAVF